MKNVSIFVFDNCSHSKTVNAWVEVVEEGFLKIYSTKVITTWRIASYNYNVNILKSMITSACKTRDLF